MSTETDAYRWAAEVCAALRCGRILPRAGFEASLKLFELGFRRPALAICDAAEHRAAVLRARGFVHAARAA